MDDEALAHALVVVALVLTGLMVISFLSTSFIAWRLRGRPGGELALVMATGTGFIAAAQALRLVNAILFDFNPDISNATLMQISILSQLIVVVSWLGLSIWSYRLWRNDEPHGDPPPTDRGEPGEGVAVQIDQVGVRPAVAIDDRDGDPA